MQYAYTWSTRDVVRDENGVDQKALAFCFSAWTSVVKRNTSPGNFSSAPVLCLIGSVLA